jgi:hypothetical protein
MELPFGFSGFPNSNTKDCGLQGSLPVDAIEKNRSCTATLNRIRVLLEGPVPAIDYGLTHYKTLGLGFGAIPSSHEWECRDTNRPKGH